jgi:polar amino acid transport system substrate-binding protein
VNLPIRRILSSLLATLWLGTSTQAAPLLAVTTEFPPFQSSQPQPWGMALETAQALAQANGDTLEVRFLPWARAYQMAETTPGLLIFCLARTPERENRYDWVGRIAPNDVTVWRLASRQEIQARSLEQAKVWQLGATAGDMKLHYLQENGFVAGDNLQVSSDDLTNLRKLYARRIDLLPFSNRIVLQYRAAQAGLDYHALVPAFSLPALSNELYLAFSPGTPAAQTRQYQQHFARLQKSGWLKRLQARYQQLAPPILPGTPDEK